jgi:predicted metalloprotease with PDZ domain
MREIDEKAGQRGARAVRGALEVIVRYFRRACLLVSISVLCSSSLFATIHYDVSIPHPERHLFQVVMTIPDVTDHVEVQIPAWNALYQIRDFAAHVQRLQATVSSGDSAGVSVSGSESPAAVEKIDKQTWRIDLQGRHGVVTIKYATYWDEAGPFATQVNQEHAFINPAMILMYVPERRGEDVTFALTDIPALWQGAGPSIQALEAMGGARQFSSKFANYDELADSPAEIGKFEEFQLEGVKPEIWVAVHGDNWKKKQVENELKRICEYEMKLMGDAPFQRYTFILHFGKAAAGGGGGMEHANSTAIWAPSGDALANVGAHEFFHLWNVKRIRPATLDPVDYTKEQYTRALWFAEGVTNTYASYTLVRTGLWSKQQFFADLAEQVTEIENRPANRWQSAEESSLDAWLEKYPLYNQPEYSISYYTKGQILGVLLDIEMRDATDNAKSLDDVLREMNKQFAQAGKPYRVSLDVQSVAEKLTGKPLSEFFKRYVAGTDALPYQQVFALAGLEMRETERKRAVLGFALENSGANQFIVRNIDADSSAAAAGLQNGDAILNWSRGDVPRRWRQWVEQQKPGEVLHLRVRRESAELNIDFPLGEVTETLYGIAENERAGEKARRIRDGLLKGTTTAAAAHAAK